MWPTIILHLHSCSCSQTTCSGKRNRTEFVPLREFSDGILHSGRDRALPPPGARHDALPAADYRFLSDVDRVADSAKRKLRDFGRRGATLQPDAAGGGVVASAAQVPQRYSFRMTLLLREARLHPAAVARMPQPHSRCY